MSSRILACWRKVRLSSCRAAPTFRGDRTSVRRPVRRGRRTGILIRSPEVSRERMPDCPRRARISPFSTALNVHVRPSGPFRSMAASVQVFIGRPLPSDHRNATRPALARRGSPRYERRPALGRDRSCSAATKARPVKREGVAARSQGASPRLAPVASEPLRIASNVGSTTS